MKKNPSLSTSMILIVLRIVLGAGMSVILYRFVILSLGPGALGVWTLVFAATSLGSVGVAGVAAGVLKFVAAYDAREEGERVIAVVHSSVLIMVVLTGLAVLLLFIFREPLLRFAFNPEDVGIALVLFPYALFSFWCLSVSSVYQALLEGRNHFGATSIVTLGASGILLVASVSLVPRSGIAGLAMATALQQCALLGGLLLAVHRYCTEIPLFPSRWSFASIREVFAYGSKFQIINLMAIIFDPLTKFFLGRTGGMAPLGYFEMANRLVVLLRQLLVSLNGVIVPTVARLHELDPASLRVLYLRNMRLMIVAALVTLMFPVALGGVISELWIGRYAGPFVLACLWLSLGWCVNAFGVPSYLFLVGQGELSWVIASHLAMGGVVVALAFPLGVLWGFEGVVVSIFAALVAGSLVTVLSFHFRRGIPFGAVFDRSTILAGVGLTAGAFLCKEGYDAFRGMVSLPVLSALLLAAYGIACVGFFGRHPAVKEIRGLISAKFRNARRVH